MRMQEKWSRARLKNVAEVNARALSATTDDDYTLRYLEISNVNNRGIISEAAIEEFSFIDAPSRAKRIVRSGDTVISSVRPNLQAVAHIDQASDNFIASTGFYVVSPTQNRLNAKYTYYLLLSEDTKQYLEAVAKGVGYPAVDDKDFVTIKILLPSINEQRRIASYLDKTCAAIDAAIEKKQKQLETLDALRKSIIHKAVTRGLDDSVELKDSGVEWIGEIPKHWKIEKMKRLLDNPLMYGTNEAAELDDPEYPRYIRITDFGDNGSLRDDTFKSLPPDKADGYYLSEGDVLFARSGATVGKSFLFRDYKGTACFAGYLIKAKTTLYKLLPEYLYYFTKSPSYDSWKNIIFTQATIQNISATKYAYLPVTVPPIDEQKKILAYLNDKMSMIKDL
jgi:type I restriction enzyme, S subunit